MNRLQFEKSPYLLQHADNPVDWFSWGEEAFQKARTENKPVFLSIGYSTCHWCHVMEEESFRNLEIAELLNKYFVAIKVDREERPDIDSVYMQATVALTGNGGWPMSLFLTAEKKPFYAGTYFPPEDNWGTPGFKSVLSAINKIWNEDNAKVLESAEKITSSLANSRAELAAKENTAQGLDSALFEEVYLKLKREYDSLNGGFSPAPKFPQPQILAFLLRYWARTGDKKALAMVEHTLHSMAQGGVYDCLAGGLHRYSTDQAWFLPHFEKMLYDQALMARVYLEVYQATHNPFYQDMARSILDYVLAELQSADGGFFCAQDADSVPAEAASALNGQRPEKKEGAFYVWSEKELRAVLSAEEWAVVSPHYAIAENGNIPVDARGEFQEKNILAEDQPLEEVVEQLGISFDEAINRLKSAKEKLFAIRKKRPPPYLDDKVLVDWNGLMISTLAFGARVLAEERYALAADRAIAFIIKNLQKPTGRLLHRYRDGEAKGLGTLDDYAFFVRALIEFYETTFKPEYLATALELAEAMKDLFSDKENGGCFFSARDAERLILRQKEIQDTSLPAGNAVAAENFLKLYHLTGDQNFKKSAMELFSVFSSIVRASPQYYLTILMAFDLARGPCQEIVISVAPSETAQPILAELRNRFLPSAVIIERAAIEAEANKTSELIPFLKKQVPINNHTTVYLCENHICHLPVNDLELFKMELDTLTALPGKRV